MVSWTIPQSLLHRLPVYWRFPLNAFSHGIVAGRLSPWARAVSLFSLAPALLSIFYWQTATSISAVWLRSETFAHGILIAPIVVYLVWTQRHSLAAITPRSSYLGALGLVLLALVWLVAHLADVLVLQQLALVAMMPAWVFALLGRTVFMAMLFPLAYLFFMVPIGEDLIPPLQQFTAEFTVMALKLSGIPVLLEGINITIPSKDNPLGWDHFLVAETCAGLRYLTASLAVGCLFAYLFYNSLWRRLAFLALAVVVPILANGIRAYGILMTAHLSGMKYAVGVDHLLYGWVFFVLVIGLLFWIGSHWSEHSDVTAATAGSPSTAGDARMQSKLPMMVALLALAIVLAGPSAAGWVQGAGATESIVLKLPEVPLKWGGENVTGDEWQPVFVGADAQLHRTYSLLDGDVTLYLAYYRQERQGVELINSVNHLYDDRRWRQIGAGYRQVDSIGLRESLLTYSSRHLALWYWYRVSGRNTTSAPSAKLLRVWDQLSGTRKGSAVVAVASDYDLHSTEATERLAKFVTTVRPALEATLESAANY